LSGRGGDKQFGPQKRSLVVIDDLWLSVRQNNICVDTLVRNSARESKEKTYH